MNVEKRNEILESALVNSFIEDYKEYKKTIDFINKDFKNNNINFQYSYDQFCVDFLNQSLKNGHEIDIFTSNQFEEFYSNFWKFNLYNLQTMISEKLDELGYEYEDFYNKSEIRKKINKKYLD